MVAMSDIELPEFPTEAMLAAIKHYLERGATHTAMCLMQEYAVSAVEADRKKRPAEAYKSQTLMDSQNILSEIAQNREKRAENRNSYAEGFDAALKKVDDFASEKRSELYRKCTSEGLSCEAYTVNRAAHDAFDAIETYIKELRES